MSFNPYNSNDDISLQRIINTPKRGIGTKTIENLISIRDELNISMYDAITSGKELEFKNLIEELKEKSKNVTLTELVDIILEKSGMKKELESEHTLEADIRLENLEEFKSITKEFENRVGEISLEEFLLETALLSDANEYKNDNNRVNLMTVHAVKGLEFDYVFIVGLEEGIFPHINSMMDKSELEEERRLCYVALTRAKKKVYLINAKMRMLYGRDQVNVPSRFINEIDQDLIESDNIKAIKSDDLNQEEKKNLKQTSDIIEKEAHLDNDATNSNNKADERNKSQFIRISNILLLFYFIQF